MPTSTGNNPKAAHYELALSDALTAGAWADATPAKSIKADPIGWAELERKLAKHSGDSIAGDLASHLLTLSLLLSAPSVPLPETTSTPHHTRIHRSRPIASSAGSLATVAELDGDEPLEVARLVALDADGRGWARLAVGEDGRSLVESGLEDVRALRERAKRADDQETASVLLAQYHIALGQIAPALALLSATPAAPPASSALGAAWVQRVRALVLLGTCYELSSPPNNDGALDMYGLAVKVFEAFPGLALPAAGGKPASTSAFGRLRELHRWAERAYFRLCIISSSSPTSHSDTLRWLRLWATFEQIYPPAFRPQRRLALRLLYLRTLSVVQGRGWKAEAHKVVQRGFEVLKGEGRPFPNAGETRSDLEEWAECCVGVWRAAGEPQELGLTLSKILWWTTTQTFASQPTLRHLTRVLLALNPEAPSDARRTLKLYVQLVTKARETAKGDTSIAHESTPATPAPATPAAEKQNGEAIAHLVEKGDDDQTFVEALLFGARMTGRNCADPKEGLVLLDQAKDVLAGSTDGSLAVAALRLELEGVWERERGCLLMALMQQSSDAVTRPVLQADALKHLLQATTLLPASAATFYALSHAQLVCRQVDDATVSIQSALELDPGMVEGWHQLALLLTAQGKWSEAAEIVEVGIDAWEEEADEDQSELDGLVARKEFGASSEKQPSTATLPSSAEDQLLMLDGRLPPATTLAPLSPSTLFLGPTPFAKLEAFLQLRMTQALIVERLEGPDEALELQQANFAFFSERCGRQTALPPSLDRAGSLKSSVAPLATNPAIVVDVGKEKPAPLTLDLAGSPAVEKNGSAQAAAPGHGKEPGSATTDGSSTGTDDRDPIDRQFATISINPPTPDASPSRTSFHLAVDDATPEGSGLNSPASSGSPPRAERKPRFLPRHLAPQGASRRHGTGLGRSASLSKLSSLRHPSSSKNSSQASLRSFSNASSIHLRSQRPSPTQSTYNGSVPPSLPSLATVAGSPPPPAQPSPAPARTPREARLLSTLWCMSAATFRRRGKLEQALGAVQEAEVLDGSNPEVWVQLGLYHDLQGAHAAAIHAFTKALVVSPLSLPATVHLARLYLVSPPRTNVDLAHGLLNSLVQAAHGWDSPEAWFFLAQVCAAQGGRGERVRECLVFAARLEEGRSVRAVGVALERWH